MLLECHDQFRQNIRRDCGNCAYGHIAGNFAFELIYATPGIADRRQDLPRIIEQTSPGLGQHHRTRQTIEQWLADLSFQLSNLLAE